MTAREISSKIECIRLGVRLNDIYIRERRWRRCTVDLRESIPVEYDDDSMSQYIQMGMSKQRKVIFMFRRE